MNMKMSMKNSHFKKVTNVITKDGIIRDSDGQVIAESKSK